MKVKLIRYTQDLEKLIAASAKLCYSSATVDDIFDNLNDENTENENPGDVEDPSDDDEKDNPEGNGPGGYGSGDLVFGSDDMFFDPETGKIMYGEVITKYESHILNIIENGELSEEHQEYFKSYFDLLFGDFKKDE